MNTLFKQLFRMAGVFTTRTLDGLVEQDPASVQEKTLQNIVRRNATTIYGKTYNFGGIKTVEDYQRQVPLVHIQDLEHYLDWIKMGRANVLAEGEIAYWVQTSGSTGKPKVIPLNKTMLKEGHSGTTRALLSYLGENKQNAKILEGKILGIVASHKIASINGTPVGYASGIISQKTQSMMPTFVVPNRETLEITNWEKRHHAIIDQALKSDIRSFAGVTPFVINTLQMITNKGPDDLVKALASDDNIAVRPVPNANTNAKLDLAERWDYQAESSFSGYIPSDASVKQREYVIDKMICHLDEIWPNSQAFFASGVPFDLYHNWLLELLGPLDFRELYACSECLGIGFQLDEQRGMWPNLDILFLEFIPFNEYQRNAEMSRTLTITEVQPNTDYVLVLTTPGGLYRYILGDVVHFTSLSPPRLIVSGRINREISLSGEKVTEHQLIAALNYASTQTGAVVSDFTATGRIDRAPRHEIAVEFAVPPSSLDQFASFLDYALCKENNAYSEIRQIGSIDPIMVYETEPGTFLEFAKARAEEGAPIGQAKIPHISSDTKIMDSITIIRAATVF